MLHWNTERKPARLEEVAELNPEIQRMYQESRIRNKRSIFENPEIQRMYQESRTRNKRSIFDILFRMWLIVMGFGITWIWLQILFG